MDGLTIRSFARLSVIKALAFAGYWASVVPVVVLAFLWATGRNVDSVLWWVAIAFTVSVVADRVSRSMGGSLDHTWYYRPIQIAAVLFAFRERVADRALIAISVLVAGLASYYFDYGPAERVVTVFGSVAVLFAAWNHAWARISMLVYFGLGTAAYMWMYPLLGLHEIRPRWVVYKLVLMLGIGLFVLVSWRRVWNTSQNGVRA